jgi:hypothetical protein
VTFEEYFSWYGELNVKSVIRMLHKCSCITDGKKENMKNFTFASEIKLRNSLHDSSVKKSNLISGKIKPLECTIFQDSQEITIFNAKYW